MPKLAADKRRCSFRGWPAARLDKLLLIVVRDEPTLFSAPTDGRSVPVDDVPFNL